MFHTPPAPAGSPAIDPADADDRGFTLVELMVVIVIIGILAAIAIPSFLAQRQSTTDASLKSDLANAAMVVEAYSATHNGSYTGLTDSVLQSPQSGMKLSPSNVIDVTSVTPTSYVLSAYNTQAGAGRTFRLTTGTISGPTP